MSKDFSRRSFLKGAASIAAGSFLAPLVAPVGVAEDAVNWDAEYDVVILGYGAAGANAAVAAYDAGATVLLAEKAPEGSEGGNSMAAGQSVMATDDAEQLYAYLSSLMGKFNNWDRDALRAYCEGCAGNFDWMTNVLGGDPEIICPRELPSVGKAPINIEWKEVENPWGLGRKGCVCVWAEFPEIETSAHSLRLNATGGSYDRGYYNLCQSAVQARQGDNLQLWFNAPGKKLLTDESNAVIGVVIEKDGKELNVRAKGGVILCCGGFEHNKDMISDYLQQPYIHQKGGLYNDGDAIKMALEVGADLWHMSNAAGFYWAYKDPRRSTVAQFGLDSTIGAFFGPNGARFMDESSEVRHGKINIGGRWLSTPTPLPAYNIHDAEQLKAGKKLMNTFSDNYVDEIASGEVLTADTLEELAEKIRNSNDGQDAPNFDTETFVSAVNAYNKRYDAGEDADYGRPYATMAPIRTSPFYAIKIGPSITNTMGGPRRNQYAQVVGLNGYPIQGLFSAGELGSIFCDMYNGSGNLGETMVFGRISGQNAALRAKGEFTGETAPATTWKDFEPETVETADSELTDSYADGTYEGVGTGYCSDIHVSVTTSGGKITSVEILSEGETPTIGGKALSDYCQAVVDSQSLEIDVSSGASNTLRGFKEAITDALSKAGN